MKFFEVSWIQIWIQVTDATTIILKFLKWIHFKSFEVIRIFFEVGAYSSEFLKIPWSNSKSLEFTRILSKSLEFTWNILKSRAKKNDRVVDLSENSFNPKKSQIFLIAKRHSDFIEDVQISELC